ncbi:hypothetical protein GMO_17430 [Gluconobacter morbifer G707]|uniref:Uncharacterized protein n=1 Tax=Gluconobacter morbifer G707 TaxID=1088869 RepID=G6XK14_9PROT|nr:hypothetical protein GMO_17430 [Gluconobacter morbifer G707]
MGGNFPLSGTSVTRKKNHRIRRFSAGAVLGVPVCFLYAENCNTIIREQNQ